MSRENVEIVRKSWAAFNRDDVDPAFKDFAPEFECDMSRAVGFNVDRDISDLPQFRRLLAEYVGSWESFQLGPDEFLDAGDQIVVPFTNRSQGRGGIELQGRGIFVWRIRDGAIVRACLYQDRERTRAACPPPIRAKLRDDAKGAKPPRDAGFSAVLLMGLQQRIGHHLNLGGIGTHRNVYDWIAARSSEPRGIAVCKQCSVVFEPSRKGAAKRCPACHADPERRIPPTNALNPTGGEDLASVDGGLALRASWCLACGTVIQSSRLDRHF